MPQIYKYFKFMPSDQKHDFFLCQQPSSSLDHGGVGTGVFPQEIQQILNQTKHISPPTTGGGVGLLCWAQG